MSYRQLLARAIAVAMIFIGAISYLLAMSGALPEIWGFMESQPAIRNGPFWETAKRFKFIATTVIPAILIASGVFVWIVSSVREESEITPQQVRRP